MGGGRCHFQDCKQRNDGVIHMFRYPVCDKVRCHRWLVATGRMDLLKLKVSQVKNKQICQHHFQDDDFMNAKKNSLKPAAIPILAGPFCMDINEQDDFPLTEDQIENEVFMPKDLKAESLNSKLYDYLTTSESEGFTPSGSKPETQNVSLSSYDYLSKIGPMKDQLVIIENQGKGLKKTSVHQVNPAKSFAPKKIAPPKTIAPKNIDVQEIIQEFDEKPIVTILSEQTVQPISDSMQAKPIRLAELKHINPISHVISNKNLNSLLIKDSIDIVKQNEKEKTLIREMSQTSDNISYVPVPSVPTQNDNNTPIVVDKPKSPSNNEVRFPSPTVVKQKSADFQEKRTFNRRLRDIIRESIDMADSISSKENDKSVTSPSQKPKTVNSSAASKKVTDNTNIEPLLSISLLQNRIQTMETLLLNRIDANTKEVYELKKLLLEKSKSEKKVEKQIKVETSHEDRKKRLFSEVSEYLSKEGKSALYEQLFVSKYPKRTRR